MALPCGPGRAPETTEDPRKRAPATPGNDPGVDPSTARVTPGAMGTGTGIRYVELAAHDNDGAALTPEGVAATESIGRELLSPPSPLRLHRVPRRATEMVEILRRSAGQEDVP